MFPYLEFFGFVFELRFGVLALGLLATAICVLRLLVRSRLAPEFLFSSLGWMLVAGLLAARVAAGLLAGFAPIDFVLVWQLPGWHAGAGLAAAAAALAARATLKNESAGKWLDIFGLGACLFSVFFFRVLLLLLHLNNCWLDLWDQYALQNIQLNF